MCSDLPSHCIASRTTICKYVCRRYAFGSSFGCRYYMYLPKSRGSSRQSRNAEPQQKPEAAYDETRPHHPLTSQLATPKHQQWHKSTTTRTERNLNAVQNSEKDSSNQLNEPNRAELSGMRFQPLLSAIRPSLRSTSGVKPTSIYLAAPRLARFQIRTIHFSRVAAMSGHSKACCS